MPEDLCQIATPASEDIEIAGVGIPLKALLNLQSQTDVDPQAWLADVLARIAEHPVQRLDELLPWNWRSAIRNVDQAA